MDLREELDTYELLAISLVIIGAVIILATFTARYIIWTYYDLNFELSRLVYVIQINGIFVAGLGLFLSLRRIYQELELPRFCSLINYSYLILLFPQMYFITLFIFRFITSEGRRETSSLVSNVQNFISILLPGIRRILLAIMFAFIFIAIVKREWVEEAHPEQEPPQDPPQKHPIEQPFEEQLESDF